MGVLQGPIIGCGCVGRCVDKCLDRCTGARWVYS
jgi:hypothetical protein